MKSLRDEVRLTAGDKDGFHFIHKVDFIGVSRFHPCAARISFVQKPPYVKSPESDKMTEQVEIIRSNRKTVTIQIKSDGRVVVRAPVRMSGKTAGTPGCRLVGPAGEIELSEGVIVAKRHIHLTPADAEELGVKDKDVVWVKIDTDGRKAILGDVVCRVSDKFARAMHIDTDEANAISACPGLTGTIYKA